MLQKAGDRCEISDPSFLNSVACEQNRYPTLEFSVTKTAKAPRKTRWLVGFQERTFERPPCIASEL